MLPTAENFHEERIRAQRAALDIDWNHAVAYRPEL